MGDSIISRLSGNRKHPEKSSWLLFPQRTKEEEARRESSRALFKDGELFSENDETQNGI